MLAGRFMSCALVAVTAAAASTAMAQNTREQLYDRAGYVVYDAGHGQSMSSNRVLVHQPARRVVAAPLVGHERYDTVAPARIVTRPQQAAAQRDAEREARADTLDSATTITAAAPAVAEPVYTTSAASVGESADLYDDTGEQPVRRVEVEPRYVASDRAAIVRRDEPVYRYSTQPRYVVRYAEPTYTVRYAQPVYYAPVVYHSTLSYGYGYGCGDYGYISYRHYNHYPRYGHHNYGHGGHHRHHGYYRHGGYYRGGHHGHHGHHSGGHFNVGLHFRF